MKNDIKNSMTGHALVSVAVSLHAFWLTNFIKTGSEPFKEVLNFYPPVGPLLGVFLVALVALGLTFWALRLWKVKLSERFAYRFYVATAIIFFFMVFPPVFEPIVELFV